MRHSIRLIFVILGASPLYGSGFTAHGNDRTAAQIISDYDSIIIPQSDPATRGDRKAIDAYWKSIEPLLNTRADLSLELFRVDPDHPRLPEFMNDRWRRGFPKDRSKREAETDDVLARSKNPALRAHALYWKAMGKCEAVAKDSTKLDLVPIAIEDFISAAPEDPRGASLLSYYASLLKGFPERQLLVERRLAFEYPETQRGKSAAGRLRQPESVGKPFELEFTDANQGTRVSMKDLRGKIVVVDFWATWCGPCIKEMPRMKQLYGQYHGKGVEFIGVSLDYPEQKQGLERLKQFVAKNGIAWPQYYQGNGWESEFSTSWGINSIPSLFVIDQEGKVFSTNAREKLEPILTELLDRRR